MKLKLEKLLQEGPKTLRKEEMIKLSGGYTYKYTGCTATTATKGDCTDGSYD